MNERILKLVRQARQYAWENETHWSADAERATLFEQKFAELIVKECADIAKHHVMNISTYADADFVEKQIQEHFGVKE